MTKIERHNLTDQVYVSLKADILNCRLMPRERMNLSVIAQELDVSIAPVREALNRLLKDNLVVHRQRGGYNIVELNPKELQDLFHLRKMFEGEALSDFPGLSTDSKEVFMKKLRKLRQTFTDLATAGGNKRERFLRADEEFHKTIMEMSDNVRLKQLFAELWNLIVFAQHIDTNINTIDHINIIDTLEDSEIDQARRQLYAHIDDTKERLIEKMKQSLR